ncbi:hypothetical protein [Cloacibacterium sp.]|uniref:hypothetical protein n=1 Tax=Cloacibacterium sp. TaxID=1913682 RepID=UPI0039E6FC43
MKRNNIISIIKENESRIFREPIHEIEKLITEKACYISSYSRVYVIRRYLFGLFSVKLYLFLEEDYVKDYFIGIL